MARTKLKASQVVEDTLEDKDGNTKVAVENSANEDKIRFTTAGTERMIIDETGKVGIGVASPASSLHVQGNLNNSYVATLDNDENTSGHVLKLNTDGTGNNTNLLEMEKGNGDIIFRARADGRFGFGPDGVDSMGAGTFVVGIDNSSHTSDIAISRRLQHLGDSDTYLDFPSNNTFNLVAGGNSFVKYDGDILINNANADVDTKIMADNGQVVVHVDAGTNRVGIGTTSPAETLDVDGIAKATSVRTGLIEYTDGDDAITIEDGGYLKFNAGIKYAKGVLVSSASSPGAVGGGQDGGWIKFATFSCPGSSGLDTAASTFLITIAGMESSNNRVLDGTFIVSAKFTNNNAGNGTDNAGISNAYYEPEGTYLYCEPLNADRLSAAGVDDFDPSTDLLMIFPNNTTTPDVDLYMRACSKTKRFFATHLGGTGQTDTFDTDIGWTINTGQSWSSSEPVAPANNVKITGTWASKVFSKLTVYDKAEVNTLEVNQMTVKVRDVNSTSTVQDTDYILRCIQNQAITITLPPKSSSQGRTLMFKDVLGNANSNNITIDGDSSDTIDGNATYVINHNKEGVTLVCDGINGWMIMNRIRP